MIENVIPAHSAGPPLDTTTSTRRLQLEGELIFQVEDELITKAQASSRSPANVAHTLANHSEAEARTARLTRPGSAPLGGSPPPRRASSRRTGAQPIPEVIRVGPQIAWGWITGRRARD